MKEHVLSKHEKNTPFKCDKCDRSYGTNKQLSKHQILVHERVNCDECGKEICNSFILKRHKASAHGILPKDYHQCEECPSFFSSETSLDKHVKSKHNIKFDEASKVWLQIWSYENDNILSSFVR